MKKNSQICSLRVYPSHCHLPTELLLWAGLGQTQSSQFLGIQATVMAPWEEGSEEEDQDLGCLGGREDPLHLAN